MLSIYLLIPLSLMLFVVAIWAVRYAVTSNQFEDLDNASQRIILDDRQERRQVLNQYAPSILKPEVTTDNAISSGGIEIDDDIDITIKDSLKQ